MRRLALIATISVMASLGVAQSDVVIPAGQRSQPVTPKVIDTTTFNPQWVVPSGKIRIKPENPLLPFVTGPANDIKPGVMLPTPVGNKPEARFPGVIDNRGYPPDLDMGIGPTWTISTANTAVAFIKKDGTGRLQQILETFFASVKKTNFVYDPKCFYDAQSQRYFLLADELDTGSSVSNLLLGVSQTNDPNGKWNLYNFNVAASIGGTNSWLDYPGFACNQDTVVFTGNMFGFSSGFTGSRILVLPKAPLLAGAAATFTPFDNIGSFTPQPARAADASSNAMYALGTVNSTTIRAYAITGGAGSSPTLTAQNIAVPAYGRPQSDIIGPGNSPIDAFDNRLFGSFYRNGNLLTAHSVANTGNTLKVRWYEFLVSGWPGVSTPKLAQSGELAGANGESFHMPAIAKNSLGDITVLFSKTSSSIMADMMYCARTSGMPAGQMGAPVFLASSPSIIGNNNGGRWGDYYTVGVDPDDFTFWGIAEVIRGGAWASEIQKWTVSNPVALPPILPSSVSTYTGSYRGGSTASIGAKDGITYDVTSAAQKGLGQVAAIQAGFAGPSDISKLSGATLEGVLVGNQNVTVQFYISDKNGAFTTPIKTANLSVGQSFSIDLPGGIGAYMASDRSVKVLVRVLAPLQKNVMPPSYNLRLDMVRLVLR